MAVFDGSPIYRAPQFELFGFRSFDPFGAVAPPTQYRMRAYHALSSQFVQWSASEPTTAGSGYPPGELSDVVIIRRTS